jgi:hypothetical protein
VGAKVLVGVILNHLQPWSWKNEIIFFINYSIGFVNNFFYLESFFPLISHFFPTAPVLAFRVALEHFPPDAKFMRWAQQAAPLHRCETISKKRNKQ